MHRTCVINVELQRMQIKLSMKEGFDNDESKKEYESVKKDEFPSIGPFLPKNYDEKTLKRAYLKAAMKGHPDRGGTKDIFQRVSINFTANVLSFGHPIGKKKCMSLNFIANIFNTNFVLQNAIMRDVRYWDR